MGVRTQPRVSLAVILPLALALFACGASSTVGGATSSPTSAPTPTATSLPSATVLQVSQSQHFTDSKSGGTSAPCANGDPLINGDCGETVTATCAAGDVLLGGGYNVDDPLAFLSSSYPSSATAWTVTAHDEGQDGGSHPVTVTAYAECLHANFSAGVGAVTSTPSVPKDGAYHEATVNCTGTSVVTGGGFRGSSSTDENVPTANGWTVDLNVIPGSSATPAIFAMCAAQHITAVGHSTAMAAPAMNTGADLSVGCPAASLLVGGGVHTIGYGNITGLMANSTLTEWLAHIKSLGYVGGPVSTYSVAEYAICVRAS